MKIEIWSDIMCPFCYIGKRNLETALAQFAENKHIEVIWKSFQLDPEMPEEAQESHLSYLMKRKAMSADQVKGMFANVTQSAKAVGLAYDFEKSVVVNSFNAHRLIQFAKSKGLGSEAEEQLFKAFFIDGKNTADKQTLTQLGKEIGLIESEIQAAFTQEKYAAQVSQDLQEARQIGVTGVPFFVFDRKYAVSGAQPAHVLLETVEQSFSEWRQLNPETKLEVTNGQSCTTDGTCQ